MLSQNMKSGMPLREFRQIIIYHGNNLFTLLFFVHRPIECICDVFKYILCELI